MWALLTDYKKVIVTLPPSPSPLFSSFFFGRYESVIATVTSYVNWSFPAGTNCGERRSESEMRIFDQRMCCCANHC